MIELKPCPFCGGDGVLHGQDRAALLTSYGWFVACTDCECKLGEYYHWDEPEHYFAMAEDAAAAWNSRAP